MSETGTVVAINVVQVDEYVAWGLAMEDHTVDAGLVEADPVDGYLEALGRLLRAGQAHWEVICPHEGLYRHLRANAASFPTLMVWPWHDRIAEGVLAHQAAVTARHLIERTIAAAAPAQQTPASSPDLGTETVSPAAGTPVLKRVPRHPGPMQGPSPMLLAATDGSLGRGRHGGAAGGWGWITSDGRYGAGSSSHASTVTAAELAAVADLLEHLPDQPLDVRIDSRSALRVLHDIQAASTVYATVPSPPGCRRQIARLMPLLVQNRQVRFQWVRGHQDHSDDPAAVLNCAADRLAVTARRARGLADAVTADIAARIVAEARTVLGAPGQRAHAA